MTKDKKPLMFWVWPETHAAIKAQARKERSTITALLNRIVTSYLKGVDK